jgi:hypothetical protein
LGDEVKKEQGTNVFIFEEIGVDTYKVLYSIYDVSKLVCIPLSVENVEPGNKVRSVVFTGEGTYVVNGTEYKKQGQKTSDSGSKEEEEFGKQKQE